jgi:hypothetical protein
MKKLVIATICLLSAISSWAGTIVLEGRYQQRNIFVINSVSQDGVGYCVYEVTVNGLITSDEINSSAFEIDLSIYSLKTGDPIVVVIKHKDGCSPKVANPFALEPSPSFECSKIDCNKSGLLVWESAGEMGKLPYVVQQFKWNKWVNVGEVMGNGTVSKSTYSFQTSLTSGLNRFREVQNSSEGEFRRSPECEITSDITPVVFQYDKKQKIVIFSSNTSYELFNSFGQIVKRGVGTTVDVTTFAKGEYYVSYDNTTTGKFIKK